LTKDWLAARFSPEAKSGSDPDFRSGSNIRVIFIVYLGMRAL
jgi:hypothetical protein